MDCWEKLYDIATGNEGDPATITPTDQYGEVILTYPDGSKAGLYWRDGDWHFHEGLNTCPGDVAARDSL